MAEGTGSSSDVPAVSEIKEEPEAKPATATSPIAKLMDRPKAEYVCLSILSSGQVANHLCISVFRLGRRGKS